MNLFEATVRYSKVDEASGKEKKVSHVLLIDTITYGHTEEVAMKWLEENAHKGERKISAIKESSIDEINTGETESDFYLCKISYSDGEKVDTMNILVDGDSFHDARDNLEESIREFLADTEVLEIKKSKIIEIIYPNRKTDDIDNKDESDKDESDSDDLPM